MDARTCADGVGARKKDRWAGASVDVRTCAYNVGARERSEMGRERTSGQERAWMRECVWTVWVQGKRARVSMDVRTCVDGAGCKGKGGNGQGEGRERVEMGGEREGWP